MRHLEHIIENHNVIFQNILHIYSMCQFNILLIIIMRHLEHITENHNVIF